MLELARLFRSAGEGSSLELIALKAAFTFCVLVTQKPTRFLSQTITSLVLSEDYHHGAMVI